LFLLFVVFFLSLLFLFFVRTHRVGRATLHAAHPHH
jgi:hypothetical protein